jgi:hypothetical protein
MTRPARALLLVLCIWPGLARAVPSIPDTSALQFHGFRAGARLNELGRLLQTLGKGRLHCTAAKADRRVTECRGRFTSAELGGEVAVWVSAMDSVAGVITLSREVRPDQLQRWRSGIEARYGPVNAQAQGNQRVMQWVRRGRMLRLTWRLEGTRQTASVSLVDGRVLDAWGRRRSS